MAKPRPRASGFEVGAGPIIAGSRTATQWRAAQFPDGVGPREGSEAGVGEGAGEGESVGSGVDVTRGRSVSIGAIVSAGMLGWLAAVEGTVDPDGSGWSALDLGVVDATVQALALNPTTKMIANRLKSHRSLSPSLECIGSPSWLAALDAGETATRPM